MLSDRNCFKKGKRYQLKLPPKLMPSQRLSTGDIEVMFVQLDESQEHAVRVDEHRNCYSGDLCVDAGKLGFAAARSRLKSSLRVGQSWTFGIFERGGPE